MQAEVDASAPARRRHLSAALGAVTDAIPAPLEEPDGGVDPITRYGGGRSDAVHDWRHLRR